VNKAERMFESKLHILIVFSIMDKVIPCRDDYHSIYIIS
jgi:hypothetical protein